MRDKLYRLNSIRVYYAVLALISCVILVSSCGGILKKDTEKEMKENGGIRMSIKVDIEDFIISISNNPTDTTLLKALAEALLNTDSTASNNFIDNFGKAFEKLNSSEERNLASLFVTVENRYDIGINSSNSEVLEYIKSAYKLAVDDVLEVLKSRIDEFGVTAPSIRLDEKIVGVIHLDLPGVTDINRIEKLILAYGDLGFWETYYYYDIIGYLEEVNKRIEEYRGIDSVTYPDSLFSMLLGQNGKYMVYDKSAVVGFVKDSDREAVLTLLTSESVKMLLPSDLVFMWSKNELAEEPGYYELYALKKRYNNDGPALTGAVIIKSTVDVNDTNGSFEILLEMDEEGSELWSRITRENIEKQIAIVFDGVVFSAPTVYDEIKGGKSSITGAFTEEEATDISLILNSGKMLRAEVLSVEVVKAQK